MNELIIEKGISSTSIEILIEKGYSGPDQEYLWHYDNLKSAFLMCYSNKINWSTRILHPNEFSFLKKPPIDSELSGLPAKIGYFYDASKLCHRAPQEDLLERGKPLPLDHSLLALIDY